MSSSNGAYFIYDERIRGSTSNSKIAHYEEYQNLNGKAILNQVNEFSCLFYSDSSFSIPIPGNMKPFSIFPQLNLNLHNFDARQLLGSSNTQIPHLFFSIPSLRKDDFVTMKFHHNDELIPPIERNFKIDQTAELQNFIQPILEQKTWRSFIEYIAEQLKIDVDRIVLYHTTDDENQVLFPFQKISNKFIDMNSGQYIFRGKFTYEILPNIYDYIESHEMQMKDKFIDSEEERISFFTSLPPPLMAQLVNFQKKVFNSIRKDTMGDFFSILSRLISSEFHFDAFDKIILIGLKHILSATLLDVFIPYLTLVTKNKALYHFKTWKDFSTWCTKNCKQFFFNYTPTMTEIDSMCIIYFVVTCLDVIEKLVNTTYKFFNHFMVKASDLKRPPIQINCFLGDPIFATSVKVNNKNDNVIILTRGFLYLVNASIKDSKKEILSERLNLSLNSSECFSIPLLHCKILPIPSEPQNACFIASKDTNIIISFPTTEYQLAFTILFHAAKSEIEKTTLYPLQVPKSTVHFIFMKNKIHAKVNVSGISWDVFISPPDIIQALERAGSGQSFKIIPSIEPTTSRQNCLDPTIKCLDRTIEIPQLRDIILKSSIESCICQSFINAWCYSVINDMIFSFSSKSSFEGLRVLRISDFSQSVSINSKELLQIQCEYFQAFLSDFKVNDTPLIYYACLACNNSAIIRYLIETNKMPKEDGSAFQRTAFFYALRNPNVSILQALLDYSDSFCIDTSAFIDNHNVSPLVYCIENNDEQRALLLLRNGALVHNTLDTYAASALEYTITKKNEKMLTLIMPFCGPRVNAPNSKGQFITHICIESGFFQGLRIIEALDEFFNPNMSSDAFAHPLHSFSETGKKYTAVDLMCLLRLSKINVNALNSKHETPIMAALIKGLNEFVKILANDPRCDLDIYNEDGMSALSLAVKYKNTEALKILIEAGALVDQPNRDGKTPLFYALSQENVNKDICRILINSSRVYQWYSNGKLPCDIATDDLKAEIERRRPPQFNAVSFRYNAQAKPNK